jgi:hypothetical protein
MLPTLFPQHPFLLFTGKPCSVVFIIEKELVGRTAHDDKAMAYKYRKRTPKFSRITLSIEGAGVLVYLTWYIEIFFGGNGTRESSALLFADKELHLLRDVMSVATSVIGTMAPT